LVLGAFAIALKAPEEISGVTLNDSTNHEKMKPGGS
jgi:hypothetical protein